MKSVAAKEQKEPWEGNMGESEWGGDGRVGKGQIMMEGLYPNKGRRVNTLL